MTSSTRATWLIPTLLILLSIMPVLGGSLRIIQLSGGLDIMPDKARFFSAPSFTLVLHIISVSLFCIFGAFQFSPGIRHNRPGWHRAAGRTLIPLGLIAALTGLWLNQFFPPAANDGAILYVTRILVGTAMTLFIILGLANILRRNIASHRAWMMRSYALGLGAGTQALIGIPWVLTFGSLNEMSRALFMALGWGINIAVVEYVLRRSGGLLSKRSILNTV